MRHSELITLKPSFALFRSSKMSSGIGNTQNHYQLICLDRIYLVKSKKILQENILMDSFDSVLINFIEEKSIQIFFTE